LPQQDEEEEEKEEQQQESSKLRSVPDPKIVYGWNPVK